MYLVLHKVPAELYEVEVHFFFCSQQTYSSKSQYSGGIGCTDARLRKSRARQDSDMCRWLLWKYRCHMDWIPTRNIEENCACPRQEGITEKNSFLTSALDEEKWVASISAALPPGI